MTDRRLFDNHDGVRDERTRDIWNDASPYNDDSPSVEHTFESQSVPDELRGLYSRLLTDGAAWSATTVATPDALINYAQQLPQSVSLSRKEPETLAAPWGRLAAPPRTLTPRPASDGAQPARAVAERRSRWAATVWAPIAAVVIVALVAAVLYGFALRPRANTPSTTSARGHWVALTPLDYTSLYQSEWGPVVAPSNPQVIYEPMVEQAAANTVQTILRRTDDGGETWHTLTLPFPVRYIQLFVSPLNADIVYVGMDTISSATCRATLPSSTLLISACNPQYISQDGGAHWRRLQLPTPSVLVDANDLGFLANPDTTAEVVSRVLRAQGSRLYADSSTGLPTSKLNLRLLASDDGGLVWRTVDTPLDVDPTGPRMLCDAAPTAMGATVFAVTAPAQQGCGIGASLMLWRSDDGGAIWSQVAPLPAQTEGSLLAVAGPHGQPYLYADLTSAAPQSSLLTPPLWNALSVSVDGGHTWRRATLAIPPSATQETAKDGQLFPWRDGGVMRAFAHVSSSATIFYAWSPTSHGWQQITAPIAQSPQTGTLSTDGNTITMLGATLNTSEYVLSTTQENYSFWRYQF